MVCCNILPREIWVSNPWMAQSGPLGGMVGHTAWPGFLFFNSLTSLTYPIRLPVKILLCYAAQRAFSRECHHLGLVRLLHLFFVFFDSILGGISLFVVAHNLMTKWFFLSLFFCLAVTLFHLPRARYAIFFLLGSGGGGRMRTLPLKDEAKTLLKGKQLLLLLFCGSELVTNQSHLKHQIKGFHTTKVVSSTHTRTKGSNQEPFVN